MRLFEWLLNPVPQFGLFADPEPEPDTGGGDEGEGSDALDKLADEGEALPPDEGEQVEDEPEEPAELATLRDEIAELKAERVFLRGEVAKRPTIQPPARTEPVIEPTVESTLDMEDLVRRVTDKDPKVGVKAIMEVAGKIAASEVAKALKEARGYTDASQQERAMKETDLSETMADFDGEFKLYGQPFIDAIQVNLNETTQAAGGKYTRRAMYRAAAEAKVRFDRQAAIQRGTKNGVTRVRPSTPANNTTVSDAGEFAKIKTISGIPDNLMSARDKAAARRVANQMGVKESEWVANYFAERANDDRFGV